MKRKLDRSEVVVYTVSEPPGELAKTEQGAAMKLPTDTDSYVVIEVDAGSYPKDMR